MIIFFFTFLTRFVLKTSIMTIELILNKTYQSVTLKTDLKYEEIIPIHRAIIRYNPTYLKIQCLAPSSG